MIQIQMPEKEIYHRDHTECRVRSLCGRRLRGDFHPGQMPEDLGHYYFGETGAGEGAVPPYHRHRDQHGTVTVMLDKGLRGHTYRVDGKYEDSRHPKSDIYAESEDLKRRDFTINAMAYNETEGLIDIFGGLQDIGAKLIRCVG